MKEKEGEWGLSVASSPPPRLLATSCPLINRDLNFEIWVDSAAEVSDGSCNPTLEVTSVLRGQQQVASKVGLRPRPTSPASDCPISQLGDLDRAPVSRSLVFSKGAGDLEGWVGLLVDSPGYSLFGNSF
ncbi:hypothetical protein CRG98_006635 [Punica granatum]|uniref:Uncharacterized protein n=1 Tax=Punica granatum TaxID=22663 RepID=A0A2I0KWT2_PUNGR|nr:hypothetical protein CRG98_006635 [Punica granatum]